MNELNPIEHVDLAAIVAPRAPAAFAEGVLARFATTEAAIAVEQRRRTRRNLWRKAGAAVALAAAISVAVAWPRHPARERAVADQARLVTIGETRVELAAHAAIEWRREGTTLVVDQHGAAIWHLPADQRLHVEVPGTAEVDATGAVLNLEVTTNPSSPSAVTVTVVAGKASLAGGGGNLTIETGEAAVVSTGQRPVAMLGPRNPATSVVVVVPADEAWLANGRLEAIQRALTQLQLPLGSTIGVMMYSNRAETAFFSKPVYDLRGSELGTLERYRDKSGTALVEGIEGGIDMMRASHSSRRLVLVLGDGRDSGPDAAAKLTRDLGEAALEHIEVRAILTRPDVTLANELFDAVAMPRVRVETAQLTEKIVQTASGNDPPVAVMVMCPAWLSANGRLAEVERALERLALPEGSTVGLGVYGASAIVSPLMSVPAFAARDREDPARYEAIGQPDLLVGLSAGVNQVDSERGARRLVVLLGSGEDDAQDVARIEQELARARQHEIEVTSVIVRRPDAQATGLLKHLGVHTMDATSRDLGAVTTAAILESRAPVAMAVLYAGRGSWLSPAVLHRLAQAIGAVDLPVGSMISAIEYSKGASVQIRWERFESYAPAQLGWVSDYDHRTSSDLVEGVRTSLAELARQMAPRKLLIIVGDGNDTNNEAARGLMEQLAAQARQLGVRIVVVELRAADSPAGNVTQALDPAPARAADSNALPAIFEDIAD